MKIRSLGALALSSILMAVAAPAWAHHPLGGLPMETFSHGLLSGVGHPLLGIDHLFFIAAVGIAARLIGASLLAPLAYIAAMLLGCLGLSLTGVAALPGQEAMIVLSLLLVGGLLLSGRLERRAGGRRWALLALFAGFGLFHGAAFAGSIVGQEGGVGGAVLLGYLLALGLVQYALALGFGGLAQALGGWLRGSANWLPVARLSGAMIAGAGLFLALEGAEGAALKALGLA